MTNQIYRKALIALAVAASVNSMVAAEYRVTGDIEEVFEALYNHSTSLETGVRDNSSISGSDHDIRTGSAASREGLSAYSYTWLNGRVLGDRAYAIATMDYSDMIVSGAPGRVQVSFNMDLSGDLAAFADIATDAVASVGITFVVDGAILRDSFGEEATQMVQVVNGETTFFQTGVLSDWSPANGTVTTPTFNVQAGQPFSLRIVLSTSAAGSGAGFSESTADFGHTLTFVSGEPVFNLPSGYSVNSLDAGIVNNQFIVPEAETLILIMLAFGFLVMRRRMRPAGA